MSTPWAPYIPLNVTPSSIPSRPMLPLSNDSLPFGISEMDNLAMAGTTLYVPPPKPVKIEDYTSPFELALTPPDPPPAPKPEIKVVTVVDRSAQNQLADIRNARWEADWTRRRDAHRRDMMDRGYCSRHMIPNCRHEDCRD